MSARKPRRPKEVFLSHASKDRQFVERIAERLEAEKVRYWYSRTALKGAQQWQDEIGAALGRCDWFVLIASPRSVQSMWVKRELAHALIQKRYEERIVPVVCRPCAMEKLSWTLDSFHRIDFSPDFESGMSSLLKVWGIE